MISLYVFIVVIVSFMLMELIPAIGCFFHGKKIKTVESEPKVSIVIPTRNEDIIIKKTIERWLKVDYPKDKIEILFVDDSNDNKTPKIIKNFAKKYKFMHYYRGEGISKLAAVVQGIKETKNPIILTSDADIIVSKSCIRDLIPYLADKKVGAVFGKRVAVYKMSLFQILDAMRLFFTYVMQKFFTNIDSAPYVDMCPCAYRRKDLLKIKYEKKVIADDLFIGIKLRQLGLKVVILPEIDGGNVGVVGNFRDYIRRGLRSAQGTIQIAMDNHYGSRFNKKYGVFGMFSVPFRQFIISGKPILWGLFIISLIVDLILKDLTLNYFLYMLLGIYSTVFLVSLIKLVAVFVKMKYNAWKFIIPLFFYPLFQLLGEFTASLSFFMYIFGKQVAWKKTTSDRT